MPEQQQPQPGAKDPKAFQPRPPFKVKLPNAHFFGEKLGITFKAGEGETRNAIAAHAALELGAQVTDADGAEAFPTPEEEEDASEEKA